jgi:hypothetical protein
MFGAQTPQAVFDDGLGHDVPEENVLGLVIALP